MAYDPQKVVDIALAEVGYLEKATNEQLDDKTANAGKKNYTKYARDLAVYPFYNGSKTGVAWCDVFVDWCFVQAYGLDDALAMTFQPTNPSVNYGAGCKYSRQYYEKNKRLFDEPKVGDQVFFYSSDKKTIQHTGLVYKADDTNVYTVEGNTSGDSGVISNGGGVFKKQYKRNYSRFAGFGRPDYGTEETEPVNDAPWTVWNFFKSKGLNDFAIAGIMGNLYAESAFKPTNLQNTYEKKLGYTDAAYTAAVDDGSYDNFIKDSAGYGLAQWTYHSRKQALLEYAQGIGKSIGDLGMQLDFMWKELQGYTSVMKVLGSASSVLDASNAVLTWYERPADQSDSAKNKRAGYGQTYYDKYAAKAAETTDKGENKPQTESVVYDMNTLRKGNKSMQVKVLQFALNERGFDCGKVDGIFGTNTLRAVKAYQKENGLTVDGIVGKKTWTKLLA